MRLNDSNNNSNDNASPEGKPPSSSVVVESIMDLLFEICIAPRKEELSTEDMEALALAALALKMVGEKAQAWEDQFEKIDTDNSSTWENN